MDLIVKVSVAERAEQASRKAAEQRVARATAELERRANRPRVDAERAAAKAKRRNKAYHAARENLRKRNVRVEAV